MGPIALFDKSFLQSLSVDESVWFAHFFMPVVCPLFYVETLADLEKAVRAGRTPEQEVRHVAAKFPELSGGPCTHHARLCLANMLGHHVPLNGQIPRPGGRPVARGAQRGVIFEESYEAEAFSRWQKEDFLELERSIARQWRAHLGAVNLDTVAEKTRQLDIDFSKVRSLTDAAQLARAFLTMRDKPHVRMDLALAELTIDRENGHRIRERFNIANYPSIQDFAPYAAHVICVQLFFRFAMAAHLIATNRPSHMVDMAYLYYLPFCNAFVSSDKLHRTCAPLFLRENQSFVWGQTLKRDLARIDAHFKTFPDSEKERGIWAFANSPPAFDDSIVRELRRKHLAEGYDDRPPIEPNDDGHKYEELKGELDEWESARASDEESDQAGGAAEPDMMVIKRTVRLRKGSWYQLPKNIKR